MSKTFKTFRAVPEECQSMLGRNVSDDEVALRIESYCDECEERHEFVAIDD